LTVAQFLGATNDQLFKMVVSLFAVKQAASAGDSTYLSLSAALFIAPYLLFSGYAGHLADRFAKRRVLVICKLSEIALMAMATLAMAGGSGIEVLLLVLFLVAAHSTVFSPSKYGCVPEIVRPEQLAQANGILEASRYAAVIIGTAAGGVLMQFWGNSPAYIGIAATVIAIIGAVGALGIARGHAARSALPWPKHPWGTVGLGVRKLRKAPSLAVAVIAITYFESTAALVMLDTLLLAKVDLGISDSAAGALGAFAAIGTAAGALIYARRSTRNAELGFGVPAGLCIAVTLMGFAVWAHDYDSVAAMLFLLGFFGGLFFVPFLAWLQSAAAPEEKGVVLSTNNFMNMAGVLAASMALWLLHDVAGLTARTIFGVSAAATVLFVAGAWHAFPDLGVHTLRLIENVAGRRQHMLTGLTSREG
jgi:acyl-[acyl-carrier-protein]-phospholipid O-acyltransferase/long-chain-fatty-acid--[acyl-carrier-protein] ligase